MWADSDDVDEYESLPTDKVSTYLMAGAMAGIGEHCVMYPVDSVKTRMQSLKPNPEATYRNIFDAFYKIIRYEGLWRPVRGINAVAAGAGPAHALYFACYEKIKKRLAHGSSGNNSLRNGLAGATATIFHDAIMNPAEVVKQRMQVYGSPYCTVSSCVKDVMWREGPRAFYRSYPTQLVMNIPFHALHFATYECMQELMNEHREYNPLTHGASGAVAGGIAAAATTPLDVCKTLLNTQEDGAVAHRHRLVRGLVDSIRTVYEMQGFAGFFRGLPARVVFQMPATAIAWSVYEFFKYTIAQNRAVGGGGGGGVDTAYLSPADIHSTLRVRTIAMAASADKKS
ncbi:PREDICTED: mitoferrin-1-like [Priapulus caudatus]|uniref:Mitoferrin-1-like n=1 Tax=Priapulus caudatus TaxID=37621 RepID=A0ABM1ENP4_PRICU|nr:PREDICTED: mitoferrin-1-like [Priapulus caudatus]